MMKARTSLWASLAIAASLGLAGCGGSSNEKEELSAADQCTADGGTFANDTCTTQADMQRADLVAKAGAVTTALDGLTGTDDDPTPTTDQIGAVNTAITALETSISGASALSAGDKAGYQEQVKTAKAAVGRAQAARTKADNDATKAATTALKKTGEKLYDALRGTGATNATALNNVSFGDEAADGLTSSGLTIDVAENAGTSANSGTPAARDGVLLKPKSDSPVAPLGGWKGADYARTVPKAGTVAAHVGDEARVYHNQEAAKAERLIKTSGSTYAVVPSGSNAGYLSLNGSPGTAIDVSDTAANRALVMAPDFLHQGTQTHPVPDKSDAVYVRGTFNGAPGEFRCETSCSSTNDGKGSPSELGGEWYFEPDENAMVSTPDDTYLYFGWWVAKNSDGEPTAASAFADEVGTIAADSGKIRYGWADVTGANSITGSATYTGSAVGKYAFKDIDDGTAHGGHFTANAELKANFGAIGNTEALRDNGVTGTIDNFKLNDGTANPGWSVALEKVATWGVNGELNGPATGGTIWSINKNAAPASGTWSATMYDEKPGDTDDTPAGDGSNIPTAVTGTFYSEFTTAQGRMVGAFGANHSGN